MSLRIGSLCTGYGGLDMAVQEVFGGIVAWHADNDPDVATLLQHRHPQVPNLGDLTAVDWASVEPVDIVTAGFPCQPVSLAGRRKATDDERWLWDDITSAIRRMVPSPRLLVFENVPGLLTAAGGAAMARVVEGLAALGYVGSWRTLRACDVGAPHRRERIFVAAWPADTPRPRLEGARLPRWTPGDGGTAADPDRVGSQWHRAAGQSPQRHPQGADRATADQPEREPADQTITLPGGGSSRTEPGRRGVLSAPDATSERHRDAGPARDRGIQAAAFSDAPADTQGDGRDEGRPEPARQQWRPDAALGRATPAHADGRGFSRNPERDSGPLEFGAEPSRRVDAGAPRVQWGPYEAAIRRWEHILGRPAPSPVGPTTTGATGLSPVFVEWLLGLSDGWVTGVPGLSRNAQLRILGNGVVPLQGAFALTYLVGVDLHRTLWEVESWTLTVPPGRGGEDPASPGADNRGTRRG